MTKMVKSFKKPVIVALEGGYNLETIKSGVKSVAEGLSPDFEVKDIPEIKF
jgi:acetoin utilization deacetylase AcuC-like enzyme